MNICRWRGIPPISQPTGRITVAEWRRPGSNRRPPGCKPGALPTELRPRSKWGMWSSECGVNSRTRHSAFHIPNSALGLGLVGVEPTTSPLSGVRSNQLSYKPNIVGKNPRRIMSSSVLVKNALPGPSGLSLTRQPMPLTAEPVNVTHLVAGVNTLGRPAGTKMPRPLTSADPPAVLEATNDLRQQIPEEPDGLGDVGLGVVAHLTLDGQATVETDRLESGDVFRPGD